jgi:peptidase E
MFTTSTLLVLLIKILVMYKKVFTGIVHATPSSEKSIFNRHKGVVVNAASYSQSIDEYTQNIVRALGDYDLSLVEISDVKSVSENEIKTFLEKSMRKTIRKAFATHGTEFDIFFTYDEYE